MTSIPVFQADDLPAEVRMRAAILGVELSCGHCTAMTPPYRGGPNRPWCARRGGKPGAYICAEYEPRARLDD